MKKLVAKLFIALAVVSGIPSIGLASPNLATPPVNNTALSFFDVYRLPANSFHTHRVWLNRGHADVIISGDGDTDLDLYIFDGDGSLAIKREGYSDDESACLNIARSGYFIIKVVNRGNIYNDYKFWIK